MKYFHSPSNASLSVPARRSNKRIAWISSIARSACFTLAVIVFVMATHGQAAEPLVVEVDAGAHDRDKCPIEFKLPRAWDDARSFALVREDTGAPVPVQRLDALPAIVVWMLDEKLPAESKRRYKLSVENNRNSENTARATSSDRALLVSVGKLPVLRYQHALMPSADPGLPYYERSGFIHPVYDPRGRMLTDAMPPDHMHQHGLMFAWVNTTFEGRQVDFWNSAKRQGTVRHVAIDCASSGSVAAGFVARLDHIDQTAPAQPKIVLHETWDVRVYNRADGYLFDLRSTQTSAGNQPLVINKNDYGGMCIRGNSAWLEPGQCRFLTSEGKDRKEGNHTRPNWCDLTGTLEGRTSGMTVFDHPSNFRFPQPVRLHPTKPYFCFAPMVFEPFTIEPGKAFVSAYRFWVHTEKPELTQIEQIWNAYSAPPLVRVVP